MENISQWLLSCVVASLSTLVVGFIWYNPKVFGNAWMKEEGLTEEELKKSNMYATFGLTLLLSFIMSAAVISPFVIHQFGAIGMIGGPSKIATAKPSFDAFMADYGTAHRTFKHGFLHGLILGIGLAFPVIAINGMFNRKSWKSIFITSGYWVVSLALMGAIICGWN